MAVVKGQITLRDIPYRHVSGYGPAVTQAIGIRNPGRAQVTEAITKALKAYPNRSELARQLGVSRKQTYAWEAGDNLPPLDTLAKLAELTGQPIVLTFGTQEEAAPSPEGTGRLDAEAIAQAVATKLDARLQELAKDAARQAAEDASQRVRQSAEQLEQMMRDLRNSGGLPPAAGRGG